LTGRRTIFRGVALKSPVGRADAFVVASNPQIDDLSEAVSMLAAAVGLLASALESVPEFRSQATAVRRLALQVELNAGRVLISA
jgi:hypothetical protein